MCDTFGPRLSGSEGLSNALEWILSEFEADGLDEPRLQPVMVRQKRNMRISNYSDCTYFLIL